MTFLLNLLQSLLYGFVMGLTSWLPISSAAHMTLMKSFLPLRVFEDYLSNMAFWSLYRSVIQLGGLAAVLLLYWNRLNPYQKGLREQRKRKITRLWLMILISCVPAGLVGILLAVFAVIPVGEGSLGDAINMGGILGNIGGVIFFILIVASMFLFCRKAGGSSRRG